MHGNVGDESSRLHAVPTRRLDAEQLVHDAGVVWWVVAPGTGEVEGGVEDSGLFIVITVEVGVLLDEACRLHPIIIREMSAHGRIAQGKKVILTK